MAATRQNENGDRGNNQQSLRRHTVSKPSWLAASGNTKEEPLDNLYEHQQASKTYTFWSSSPAVLIYGFVVLSILNRDAQLLHGATLVMLFQICKFTSKWIVFVLDRPMLQECIEISQGYIKLVTKHIAAFLKSDDRFSTVRKVTAATVIHQRHTQLYVLNKYLKRRDTFQKKKTLKHTHGILMRMSTLTVHEGSEESEQPSLIESNSMSSSAETRSRTPSLLRPQRTTESIKSSASSRLRRRRAN